MEGQHINQILVDNGAAMNILSASILKILHNDKCDLITTEGTICNFYGENFQPLGIFPIELAVGNP